MRLPRGVGSYFVGSCGMDASIVSNRAQAILTRSSSPRSRQWRCWPSGGQFEPKIGAVDSRASRAHVHRERHQRWTEGEAVRLVKGAWREGFRGLACIIATAWDTQFSPVDVRTLQERRRAMVGGRLVFDRQADGRAKTGRAAIGTVSRRTERLISEYLAGVERLPDAVLFRMRKGSPYREAALAHDFEDIREVVFPGDRRRLMDGGRVRSRQWPAMSIRRPCRPRWRIRSGARTRFKGLSAGRDRGREERRHGPYPRASQDA
jgi:hypothetical protein